MARQMTRAELLRIDQIRVWSYSRREALLGPPGEGGLVTVATPALEHLGTSRTRVHRRIAEMFLRCQQLWVQLDVHRDILSWEGAYSDRSVRGNPGTRSTHAWGAAFDLNAAWNGLGKPPAAPGTRGSVNRLIGVAQACGFAWGGQFSRPDGMHFEPYLLLPEADLPELAGEEPSPSQRAVAEAWPQVRPHMAAIYGIAVGLPEPARTALLRAENACRRAWTEAGAPPP